MQQGNNCNELFQHARPLEMMRGRYMVKNPKAVAIMWLFDAICRPIFRRTPPTVTEMPERILVCNWAHLGDVVLSLPSLKALRDAFPNAKIGLLIGSWSAPVVQNTNLYDYLHVLDNVLLDRRNIGVARGLIPFVQQCMAVIKDIKTKRYDVAIDLYSYFPNTAFFLYWARVPIRCGFTSGGLDSFLTHPVRWRYEKKSIGRYGQNLFAALWPDAAIALDPLIPCYPRRQSAPLPPMLVARPYLVLHLGAGVPLREWPDSHWKRLIGALIEARMYLAIVGAGPREVERARRVASALGEPEQNSDRGRLFLDLPWDSYVTLVANAQCVVCLESSAGHVAAAFQIPTIAIYGGMIRSYGGAIDRHTLWGPDNPQARVLSGPTSSTSSVTPEMVFDAVIALLNSEGDPGNRTSGTVNY